MKRWRSWYSRLALGIEGQDDLLLPVGEHVEAHLGVFGPFGDHGVAVGADLAAQRRGELRVGRHAQVDRLEGHRARAAQLEAAAGDEERGGAEEGEGPAAAGLLRMAHGRASFCRRWRSFS